MGKMTKKFTRVVECVLNGSKRTYSAGFVFKIMDGLMRCFCLFLKGANYYENFFT